MKFGFSYWPAFISAQQALSYWESIRRIPRRRVICGDRNITWMEQPIEQGTLLFDFFLSDGVLQKINDSVRTRNVARPRLMCWSSIYGAFEYIDPHMDTDGDLQIILCLKSVKKKLGGTLVLEFAGRRAEIHLSTGDAVLFKATKVLHHTTPLLPSKLVPNPERIVAVGRYFFAPQAASITPSPTTTTR